MGLIFSHAALLLEAKKAGTCFDEIVTIGRQLLYLTDTQAQVLAKRAGRTVEPFLLTQNQYAENLFKAVLDAKRVLSLDYSNYEHCDFVHDMNEPIDPSLHEKFDAVIDGGSLEHIFNFPVAISNCMKMVKKNGSIFIFTVANNFLGHGFYQFSPELFFRIFSSRNGFEIRNLILERHRFPGVELSATTKMYEVSDPAALRERVGLVTSFPVMLLVHAVKTETHPQLISPIQSDYASTYESGAPPENSLSRILANEVLRYFPRACRNYLIGRFQLLRYSFWNRRFYKRCRPH